MRTINERAIRERLVRGPGGVYRLRDRVDAPEIPSRGPSVCPTCNGELRIDGIDCPTCLANPFYGLDAA